MEARNILSTQKGKKRIDFCFTFTEHGATSFIISSRLSKSQWVQGYKRPCESTAFLMLGEPLLRYKNTKVYLKVKREKKIRVAFFFK